MSRHFRRYTELPYLLHMLEEEVITLLNPNSWDDKNDVLYLEAFQRKKKLESVLALCLTDASATYHHWKVFSHGSSGVCIKFNKERLIEWARDHGISCGPVVYRSIKKAKEHDLPLEKWPFVKRHAFRDEREFRLIFECREEVMPFKAFKFDPTIITKITLNPWLPASVCASVERAIRDRLRSSSITIRQTTLLRNEDWLSKVHSDT
jgi:hypothetical protein